MNSNLVPIYQFVLKLNCSLPTVCTKIQLFTTKCFFLLQNNDLLQVLSDVLYECVTQEKPEVIASHIALDQVMSTLLLIDHIT